MTEKKKERQPTKLYPAGERAPHDGLYECQTCRREGKIFQTYLAANTPFPPCPGCRLGARWSELN